MKKLPFCECGCGERVSKLGNRFILGHHRRGVKHSPESIALMSVIKSGKNHPMYEKKQSLKTSEKKSKAMEKFYETPRSPEHCMALSKAHEGVSLSPEHIAAALKGREEAWVYDAMRGGDDLVTHHYIYDESDLSLNTVQMTRKDHTSLHNVLRKLGYIILHINVKEMK